MLPSVLKGHGYLDGFDEGDDDDTVYKWGLSWVGVVGPTRDPDQHDPLCPPYTQAAPGSQKQQKTTKNDQKTTKKRTKNDDHDDGGELSLSTP